MSKKRIGGFPITKFLKIFSKNKDLAKKAYVEYKEFSLDLISKFGLTQAIKSLKDINNRCRRKAAGYPLYDYYYGNIWFKTGREKSLPKALNALNEFIDVEPNTALIIPNIVYTLYDKPNFDVTTLEEEDKSNFSDEEIDEFSRFCQILCPKLKLEKVNQLFTVKGGPNGPSAISHAQDLIALNLITVGKPFSYYCDLFHGENSWLKTEFEEFSKDLIMGENIPLKWRKESKQPLLAKLEFISAPAGKTRIVYVANWWIQALLLPMNEALFNCFRIIGNDATWDQNSGVERIKRWSAEKKELFSFDLTAATDRWPVWHQYLVMRHCFTAEIADAWKNFISIPPYSSYHDRYVPYKTGQPMGLFTSWAALNMSHHLVIRYLRRKNKVSGDYIVLGDDMVIAGRRLAELYKDYMTKLGVKINMSKSLSCDPKGPYSAEFARNIIKDGVRVSSISPNILVQLLQNGLKSVSFELIKELREIYGLKIYVYPHKALVHCQIAKLIGYKTLRELSFTLFCKSDIYFQYVEHVHSAFLPDEDISNYKEFKNPWFYAIVGGLDIDKRIEQIWRQTQSKRVKTLIGLSKSLDQPSTSVTPGFALELKSHPIRYILRAIDDEITRAFVSLYTTNKDYKKLNPLQLTTSLDLIESVFVKGQTYNRWQNSQVRRNSNLLKFMRQVYKIEYDLFLHNQAFQDANFSKKKKLWKSGLSTTSEPLGDLSIL